MRPRDQFRFWWLLAKFEVVAPGKKLRLLLFIFWNCFQPTPRCPPPSSPPIPTGTLSARHRMGRSRQRLSPSLAAAVPDPCPRSLSCQTTEVAQGKQCRNNATNIPIPALLGIFLVWRDSWVSLKGRISRLPGKPWLYALISLQQHFPESIIQLRTGWAQDAWLQWSSGNWYSHLDISRWPRLGIVIGREFLPSDSKMYLLYFSGLLILNESFFNGYGWYFRVWLEKLRDCHVLVKTFGMERSQIILLGYSKKKNVY